MNGDKSFFDTLDLQSCEQFAGEMQACCWRYHRTFFFGEDALVGFGIGGIGGTFDIWRERSVAEFVQCALEFIVRAVMEKT